MKLKLSRAINIYTLFAHFNARTYDTTCLLGETLRVFVLLMFQGDGLILDFLFGFKFQSAGQNFSLKASKPLNKTSDILIPKVILLPSD